MSQRTMRRFCVSSDGMGWLLPDSIKTAQTLAPGKCCSKRVSSCSSFSVSALASCTTQILSGMPEVGLCVALSIDNLASTSLKRLTKASLLEGKKISIDVRGAISRKREISCPP